MNKGVLRLYMSTYILWIGIFVILPLLFLLLQSFRNLDGQLSLINYLEYFKNSNYLWMSMNSVIYAFLITLLTLLIAYPAAYCFSRSRHADVFLMLVLLPTWINLLLKVYAFIGLMGHEGPLLGFLQQFGLDPTLLFTRKAFLLVAAYVEIPFMIIPIYNSLVEIPKGLLEASKDLGATSWTTFRRVIWPLSQPGVKSGVQAVFIPALSLFMITRLIGGNRVITLGTAIEEHFLVTQNWGMGSAIGIILVIAMALTMLLTTTHKKKGGKGRAR